MKSLTREAILRMTGTEPGSGIGTPVPGGGGNTAGLASESWVDENYIGKDFFNEIFEIQGKKTTTIGSGTPVEVDYVFEPNELPETKTTTEGGVTTTVQTEITKIKIKAGAYTDSFLSALGLGTGGGSGSTSALYNLIDVKPNAGGTMVYGLDGTFADNGKVLTYNATYSKWVAQTIQQSGGTVTSIAMTVPTGFAISGSPITNSGTLSLTFDTGYALPTTAKQTNWDSAYTFSSNSGFGTDGTDSIPITLGSTTKTVLTAHQSLSNYYNKSEADLKFMTIAAFENLFNALNSSGNKVNHPYSSAVANIKAMFGLWTNQYLSALGVGSGGSGSATALADLSDVSLNNPSAGQILVYRNSHWVNENMPSPGGSGTVTSITLTTPTGLLVNNNSTYTITTNGTFALSLASGYEMFKPLEYFDASKNAKKANALNVAAAKKVWGQTYLNASGEPQDVTGAMTGVTSIDNNMYFDTTNNRVGIGVQSPTSALDVSGKVTINNENGYAIEAYGQLRFNASTDSNHSQRIILGCFSGTGTTAYQPFIRFRGNDNTTRDFAYMDSSNDYRVGAYDKALYLYGRNVNIYSAANTTETDTVVLAMKAISYGRIFIGESTSSYSPISNTDYKLIVRGNQFIDGKLYLYRPNANSDTGAVWIEYDSNASAIKINGSIYATGYVSALGNGSGGSGSATALADLSDVSLNNPSAGQILVYRNSHWVNENMPSPGGSGTVTSISAGTGLSGGTITSSGTISIDNTYLGYIAHGESAFGYFTNGVADNAARLTTVNKQAWGNTYWTANGVPQDVSGNMTGVGDITMDGTNYRKLIFDTNYYIVRSGSQISIRVGGSEELFSFSSTQFYSKVGILSEGYVTALSDIRHKDVCGTPELTVEDIAQTQPILFTWKDKKKDQSVQAGAIAQEWQNILPEVVRDNDGVLSLSYGVAALISSMIIAKRVVNHEQRLQRIEKELFN